MAKRMSYWLLLTAPDIRTPIATWPANTDTKSHRAASSRRVTRSTWWWVIDGFMYAACRSALTRRAAKVCRAFRDN